MFSLPDTLHRHPGLWLALLLPPLFTACGSLPQPRGGLDGAPSKPVDVASIADAVPRPEPPSKYGNPPFYDVNGVRYQVMTSSSGYVERGIASWYGTKFHGRRTSSGEPYDMYAMTAAHRELPLPCYAEVTNLRTNRKITVRVNDRGPFHPNRLIDLSYAAAYKLGILDEGTGLVEVRVIEPTATTPIPVGHRSQASGAKPVDLYLQVGAFVDKANAERLQAKLASLAPQRPVSISAGAGESTQQPIYRVRIGPLANADEADRLTAQLNALGIDRPRIVVD